MKTNDLQTVTQMAVNDTTTIVAHALSAQFDKAVTIVDTRSCITIADSAQAIADALAAAIPSFDKDVFLFTFNKDS